MTTTASDLGQLIMDINPYLAPPNGPMDIFVGNPDPNATPTTIPPTNRSQIELMFDASYSEGQEWTFRGEPQHVQTAARIRYRYKATGPSGNQYWINDYLLIGFVGSGGP